MREEPRSPELDAAIERIARDYPLGQAAVQAFPWTPVGWTDSHGEYDGQLRRDAEDELERQMDADRETEFGEPR